jgi:twitching motility protein PilT
MELNQILARAMALGASDIHLKHGLMPVLRVHGRLVPLDKKDPRLSGDEISQMADAIMTPIHKKKFADFHEVDMGYGVPGLGRFRVNIFQQRGSVGMVIRAIPFTIKTVKELNLPLTVERIASYERGLILVTGITGSGKSTTLASIIDHINNTRTNHILTIEDPIEYLIRDRRSIVNQRELGIDTPSYTVALRQALRQDPDVILIGEMRDKETIQTALIAAETGHLVFSTLHTADATETVNRILGAFEPHEQSQIRLQLTGVLRAVVSQRLIPKKDKSGVVPACEIMVVNARIKEMIANPQKTREIPLAIDEGSTFGMQSFDQSLMSLLKEGLVTFEEAVAASSNPDDFQLRHKGIESLDSKKWSAYDNMDGAISLENMPKIEMQNITDDIDDEKTPRTSGTSKSKASSGNDDRY